MITRSSARRRTVVLRRADGDPNCARGPKAGRWLTITPSRSNCSKSGRKYVPTSAKMKVGDSGCPRIEAVRLQRRSIAGLPSELSGAHAAELGCGAGRSRLAARRPAPRGVSNARPPSDRPHDFAGPDAVAHAESPASPRSWRRSEGRPRVAGLHELLDSVRVVRVVDVLEVA